MARFASIDIGTNSVLLLVAERTPEGTFEPVLERAEITRLGKGVDQSRRLADDAIERTVAVLESYAQDAKRLGATDVVASATSAARDAANGAQFMAAVKARAGINVEIIAGDEEARLSFASARADFGGHHSLVVMDIGGGSTELIYGDATGQLHYRHSFDVGSVRLTERFVRNDPMTAAERRTVAEYLATTFAPLPPAPAGARLVAVAGTATTVFTIARAIDPYDPKLVHGGVLSSVEVTQVTDKLCATPVELRQKLKGLQPKRADVIPCGALILEAAMTKLGFAEVTISDRGLRWGLLVDRFGARP